MSPAFVIIVTVLGVIITFLILFLVKNMLLPKRVESVPKLIKQGKTQNAIKMAKQIIAKDPKNYKAHYYLGKAYQKENRTELALYKYKLQPSFTNSLILSFNNLYSSISLFLYSFAFSLSFSS